MSLSGAQRPWGLWWPLPGATGAALLVVAVAFALRLSILHPAEPGPDGFASLALAREPLPTALDFLLRDPHPPLYYLMLRGWLALGGMSILTARWLSIAGGLLSLCLGARLVREIAGPRSGMAAALLLALAPAHIFASAMVRDYALGLALSLLAFWLYPVRIRQRDHLYWMEAVALAVATAAAILTWYYHMVFLVLQGSYAALSGGRGRRALLGLGGGLAAAAPWLLLALSSLGPQLLSGRQPFTGAEIRWVPLSEFAGWLAEAVLGKWSGLPAGSSGLLVAAVTGVSWAILALRRAWLPVAFTLGGSFLGLAMAYGVAIKWEGFFPGNRLVLAALPFLLAGWALALGALRGPAQGLWGAVLLLTLLPMLGSYRPFIGPYPYERFPAVAYLPQQVRPDDAVLFTDIAWRGYYDLVSLAAAPAITVHYAGMHYFTEEVERALDRALPALAQAKRVWVVDNQPDRALAQALVMERLLGVLPLREQLWLEEDPGMVARHGSLFGSILVSRYGPGAPAAWGDLNASFGEVLRLRRGALPPEARPEEVLAVSLEWLTLKKLTSDYTVFVHIVSAAGAVVAQDDAAPRLWTRPTSTWQPWELIRDDHPIRLPTGLPPGIYRVIVGLYQGVYPTEQRLRLPNGDSVLELGSFLVVP